MVALIYFRILQILKTVSCSCLKYRNLRFIFLLMDEKKNRKSWKLPIKKVSQSLFGRCKTFFIRKWAFFIQNTFYTEGSFLKFCNSRFSIFCTNLYLFFDNIPISGRRISGNHFGEKACQKQHCTENHHRQRDVEIRISGHQNGR
jgi:hypothetical protein